MPLEMNPEIRAQWCAALRSGEYKQAREALRGETADGTTGYCCLGVLTDLYVKAGHDEDFDDEGPDVSENVWDNDVLTVPVREWAGLADGNPQLTGEQFGRHNGTAAGMNDDGIPFAEIADLIDGGGQP